MPEPSPNAVLPNVPDYRLTPLFQVQSNPYSRAQWNFAGELRLDPMDFSLQPMEPLALDPLLYGAGSLGSGVLSVLTPPRAETLQLPVLAPPAARAAKLPSLPDPWPSLLQVPYDLWRNQRFRVTVPLPWHLGPLRDLHVTLFGGRDAYPLPDGVPRLGHGWERGVMFGGKF